MNDYIKYIICSLSLICFSPLFSQVADRISWNDQRLFRLGVYNAIENYERFATLFNSNYEHGFKKLFVSNELEIYNDLIGLSSDSTLYLNDYVNTLREKADVIEVFIKNVNIGFVYENNGQWCIDVDFDKHIRYFDKAGIPLSSKTYYGTSYKIYMTFVLYSGNQPKIAKLDGKVESGKTHLPETYFAVERMKMKKKGDDYYNPRDFEVICNGNKLDFMEVSEIVYALVPCEFENATFVYPGDDDISVKAIPVENATNRYYLKYKPSRWRLKLNADFSLGNYYDFEIIRNDKIESKSSSNELTLDIGYVFPATKKLKVGFFTGAGLAFNKFELNADSWEYSSLTNGSADIDGDAYARHYAVNNIRQEYSTMDVVIPVYLNFERILSKWFSLYLNLGAKMYYNVSSSLDALKGNYSTWGVYEKYDDLVLDYRSGINGFTNDGVLDVSNMSSKQLKPETMTFDAFGSLGFMANITKKLQFECGVTYQKGLTDYFKPIGSVGGSKINSVNISSINAPMMYFEDQDKEIVHSFIDAASSVKRQTFKVNVGLILKF